MILGHDDNLISPADQAHDEHQADLAQHDARRDRLDDFAPSPPRAEKPSRTLPVASSGDGPTVTTSSPGGRGATLLVDARVAEVRAEVAAYQRDRGAFMACGLRPSARDDRAKGTT